MHDRSKKTPWFPINKALPTLSDLIHWALIWAWTMLKEHDALHLGSCTAFACATAHIQDINSMHLHWPLYGMTPASCVSLFFSPCVTPHRCRKEKQTFKFSRSMQGLCYCLRLFLASDVSEGMMVLLTGQVLLPVAQSTSMHTPPFCLVNTMCHLPAGAVLCLPQALLMNWPIHAILLHIADYYFHLMSYL